jgi:signal transduction histidine kinase
LLEHAFLNLLLNAIKAMPNGGILSIETHPGRGEVRVDIADTGQGISPDDLDKIFDPFYTAAPVGQGSGLGLSICYSIVKQHCGLIEVDSLTGKGSTFTVVLPFIEEVGD